MKKSQEKKPLLESYNRLFGKMDSFDRLGVKEGKLDEYGPMYGSQNRNNNRKEVEIITNLEREIEDLGMHQSMMWERISGRYLNGEEGSTYWNDLDSSTLRSAIDDAESFLKTHKR